MVALALLGGSALGCTLEAMPLTSPAPRELVLPHLSRRCLKRRPAQPRLELVEAGAEPRQRLRLVPRGGLEAQIRLLDGPSFEDGRYTVTTEWIDAGRRGQTCHRFTLLGGLDPEDDPDDPIVGVLAVGSHGAIALSTDGLDPTSQRVEQELREMLATVDPLLPKAAVGVGARWRHRDEGWKGGEMVELTAEYRLRSLEGSHLVVEVEQRWKRPAGTAYVRGKRRAVEERSWRRWAVLDFDLRQRPLPSARFFDEQGREVARIAVAYR